MENLSLDIVVVEGDNRREAQQELIRDVQYGMESQFIYNLPAFVFATTSDTVYDQNLMSSPLACPVQGDFMSG